MSHHEYNLKLNPGTRRRRAADRAEPGSTVAALDHPASAIDTDSEARRRGPGEAAAAAAEGRIRGPGGRGGGIA